MTQQVHPTLRRQIDEGATIVAPGVHDPLAALVVEHLGFHAAFLGGWAVGSQLGVTEPMMTMTEMTDAAERITSVSSIPLIVDGGAGWGEAVHTRRTVKEFERVGVQGIQLEDQHYPKRLEYHRGIETICPRDEFLRKIETAVDARDSDEFVILARTDAGKARNGGIDEAIWRSNAALEAGADAVLPLVAPAVVSVDSLDPELRRNRIRQGLPDDACVAALSGHIPGQRELTVDELAEAGYRIIMYPVVSAIAYVGVLESLYRPLKKHGRLALSGVVGYDVEDFPRVQGLTEAILPYGELLEVEDRTVPVEDR